ncbi:MAG: hypothetical protein Q8S00_20715, partial [Deltaproteobacteria bacterium]|nr:hypothetical protein [Deltaproteobacteria bacterium]
MLTKKSRGKELAAAVMVVRSVLDRFRRAILPHRPVIFILILFSFALLLRLIYGSYAIPLVAVVRRRASTIQFRHSKQEEVLVSHAPHNGAKVLEFG